MCEFCRGFHSKPAEGFFCGSPNQRLGTVTTDALRKLGTTIDDLTPASGYVVIAGGTMHHLGKVPLAQARRVAMASGDTATIAAAMGFADVDQLVWRNVESIDRTPGGQYIGDDGELLCKLSPTEQLEDMTDAYADALRTEYSKWAKGQVNEYFKVLDVNWYDVDDVGAVFAKAGDAAITDKKDTKKLSAAWTSSALLYTHQAAAQAREFAKTTFLPKIGSGISEADHRAMKFMSAQPGFFVRNHLGQVDARLTKAGSKIVTNGMRDGLGYREIGQELRDQLPGMWGKYGANYANVVANAGVQRSRAFAEISSYVEAGIEYAELIAVLDQKTTEICRYLDGQVIKVDNIVEILNRTLEIENPEDIKQVSPWVSTKKNADGVKQLVTRNGVVLADILRSGYGKIDDRGEHRARIMGDELATDASIGPPPYHGYCRTTMNPVVKTFSVPPITFLRAISTAPLNPKAATKITTPNFLRGLTGAAYVNSIGASDRGYTTGPSPTSNKPVVVGMPGDPEAGVWGEDGWLDNVDATEQVNRRVLNSTIRLSEALSELYRAKGRPDLSFKQKGAMLRAIFKDRVKQLRSGAVTLQKVDFTANDRVRGDMPRAGAGRLRRYALSFLSDRMLSVVARRKLPRIVENQTPKSRPRGFWDQADNVLFLPRGENAKQLAVVLRVFAEYFDTFGNCGRAAVIARNASIASDTVYNVNGIKYLDVATASFFDGVLIDPTGTIEVDPSAGAVTGASDVKSAWTMSAYECLADGFEVNLGFLWDTAPAHVAFILAYIEGQFV